MYGRNIEEVLEQDYKMKLRKNGVKWLHNDGSDNGLKIMVDGSLRKMGLARVFEDLVGDVMSKRLYATSGTIDYNWDENAMKFQKNGSLSDKSKRLQYNLQVPHGAAIGVYSYFRMHLHLWIEGSLNATYAIQYRKERNGEEKNTSWTTITTVTGNITTKGTNDIFDPTGKTVLNQITIFPEIDISDMKISDTIQIRLARTDGNTGDQLVYFIDGHIAMSDDGSEVEFEKGN